MLTRLEIYPVEIGMNLQGVFEDGNIFKPDVLDIDVDEFMLKMQQASGNAFNLAIETAWVSSQTIKSLLIRAYNNAFILAMEKRIINKETIKHLISKANSHMISLSSETKIGFDKDLKK
jgi:large subunit ribosomal protein L10